VKIEIVFLFTKKVSNN